MANKVGIVNAHGGGDYARIFRCLGCKETHHIPVVGDHAWGYNGSLDRPTFTPSILVHPRRRFNDAGEVEMSPRCHSFVTDGKVAYCADSTHALAGQTVDLPDWDGSIS